MKSHPEDYCSKNSSLVHSFSLIIVKHKNKLCVLNKFKKNRHKNFVTKCPYGTL